MELVTGKDCLEIYSESLISNIDFDVVTRLYQPIIGHKAAILYFTLSNFANLNEGEIIFHEQLFNVMQITSGNFILARKSLEACGLIKTYVKLENDVKRYTIVVLAPYAPNKFLSDVLLRGVLTRYIGTKEVQRLASKYKVSFNVDESKDVTASFVDVFHPELDSDYFTLDALPYKYKNHESSELWKEFVIDEFFSELEEQEHITKKALTNEDIVYIQNIALLYGLSAKKMANIVGESFVESLNGKNHIDYAYLKDRVIYESKTSMIFERNNNKGTLIHHSGKTKLANEVESLSDPHLSPREYLQNKQNGAPLSSADADLLNYLFFDMNLNNSVIKALLYHCLEKCDNALPRKYVEKLASSLARSKIDNALDALNYLSKSPNNRANKKINTIENVDKEKTKKFEDDLTDEELDKMIHEAYRKK